MHKGKLLLALGFIVIGILTRTILHVAPNVEFVTAISLLSGYYLRGKYAYLVPFIILVLTDTLIGNTRILVFTWSAFLLAGYFGTRIRADGYLKKLVKFEFSGIAFTLFFYLWTNFGVVVLGTMYPKTVAGLIQSYIMGLPFLKPQLTGNLMIIPLMAVISEFALYPSLSINVKALKNPKNKNATTITS